jgi:hypothetical protein
MENVVCIFYSHLENFVVIWHIFQRFGTLQDKSGNPGNISQHLNIDDGKQISIFL